MKIKFLMAGMLSLVSMTVFAQQGELKKAKEAYDKFDALKATPLGISSLNQAKAAIDKASANEKTAQLPQTLALKGAIYAVFATQDTVAATSEPLFNTANDAIKQAITTDTKKEFASTIADANYYMAQYQLNKGVKEFTAKKYELAYNSFDSSRKIVPEDTTATYYTALAATNAGKYPEAISNYSKLLTTNFSKKEEVYLDLSQIQLLQKDTVAALKVVSDGMEKFPSSSELRKREIEIGMMSGKQQEILGKIEKAIAADPKNKTLYYYAGITNSQFADAAAGPIKKATDPAKKAALQAQRDAAFIKAADLFKKALVIDPAYFEAVLNLAYATLTPGIDLFNAANNESKQKDYDLAMTKANAQFEVAKPYVLKATELQPKSEEALTNLKLYYLGTKNTEKANETQKRIDALKTK